MPISLDQGLGILVWSPLARWAALRQVSAAATRRAQKGSRHFDLKWREPPIYNEERLFDIVDVLIEIADEHDVSAARVAHGLAAATSRR